MPEAVAATGETLPANQVPSGIGSYIDFNFGKSENGLLGQAKQLGNDMVDAAKSFIGIEDEPSSAVSSNYQIQFDTFKHSKNPHNDIRSVYQTFRQLMSDTTGILRPTSISYRMSNYDFLYCDTFDLNTNPSFMSKPEIQKIVLNEFQPYDQIFLGQTIQAVLGGVLNFAGGVGKALGEARWKSIVKRYNS